MKLKIAFYYFALSFPLYVCASGPTVVISPPGPVYFAPNAQWKIKKDYTATITMGDLKALDECKIIPICTWSLSPEGNGASIAPKTGTKTTLTLDGINAWGKVYILAVNVVLNESAQPGANPNPPPRGTAVPQPDPTMVTNYALKVDIKKPTGDPASTSNPSSAWLTTPCYHWDFQGVSTNSAGVYGLTVEGEIQPTGFTYGWTTIAATAVGTLTGTGASPTHNPPATANANGTQGTFQLEALNGTTPTGCKDNTDVVMYLDHLGKDKKNFGTSQSCDAGIWSTPFGSVAMTLWNCHGGASHAYNGIYTPSAKPHFADSWSTVSVGGTDQLAYPFSAAVSNAINAMSRGDVVTYHCTANEATSGPGHSNTSLGGSTTWGANNAPLLGPPPFWRESWKWGQTSAFDCADDLHAHWPSSFPGWSMDYIKIHKRP